MVSECKSGKTEQSIEEIGRIIVRMGKVRSGTQMGIITKENLRMINPMDMGFTHVPMGQSMKEFGLMIFSMDKVRQNGQMDLVIWVIMLKAKDKASELTNGQMKTNIVVNGLETAWMALAAMNGLTEESTKVIGRTI